MEHMEKFAKFKDEDIAMLAEMGFIAINQLDEVSAMRLFTAVKMLDHEQTIGILGTAIVLLHKMDLERAMILFNNILEREPEHYLAQTYIAVCQILGKKHMQEGVKAMERIQKATEDPTILQLCDLWLGIVKEHKERESSPLKGHEASKEKAHQGSKGKS